MFQTFVSSAKNCFVFLFEHKSEFKCPIKAAVMISLNYLVVPEGSHTVGLALFEEFINTIAIIMMNLFIDVAMPRILSLGNILPSIY